MDQELIRAFIRFLLSDVAERRTDAGEYPKRGQKRWTMVNGERRRIFVHGDRVCYQGQERFHGSDAECRLALTLGAAEMIKRDRMDYGSKTKASLHIADELLASKCKRLRRRFLRSEPPAGQTPVIETAPAKRIRPKNRMEELNQLIADEKEAKKTRSRQDSARDRLAATIRRQANRYRNENAQWIRDLDTQVQLFRGSHFSDAQWNGETEERNSQWLAEFAKRDHFEWFEAMRVVSAGRVYQEQEKFEDAVRVYRVGVQIARKADMSVELRVRLIGWLLRRD